MTAKTGGSREGSGKAESGELSFTEAEVIHAAHVVSLIAPIVPALAQALRPRTEVVLHDLTKMPNTIAAIAGSITGRQVGGPATDLGLRTFSSGWSEHLIGYPTETADGLVMRSSSIFFHAESGKPVCCLCLNTDVDDLRRAQEVLAVLTATTTISSTADGPPGAPVETFPVSVDELAAGILRDAIAAIGVPVELMKKAHKVAVVRELDGRGFFTIREAVDLAAQRLGVSRFTIYNYLNELQGTDSKG
ncbi:putative transcriptional regulator YheO [Kibdelosporangium banguiense]|uniref:Transcriptional regulator YheO n=1 Tax=Kibdelosporangium banguiense TaxID=1365924 RepID=A0ABS4TZ61_9PSEU|nr:PAS domain-containing protein [Kibdelosporangium banguiense]MBP2329244.1 putative transcriptional regulator YheO [Kibdelosporangium banguiense]